MANEKKLINVEGLTKVASGIKGYVDKKDQAMDARVKAVEERAQHAHDNKDVLDGITAEKVQAWDGKAEVSAVEVEASRAQGEEARIEGLVTAEQQRAQGVEQGFETRIAANEDAIEVLNGEGEGSVKKAVADGIAGVVANADADFDTLKEVADWIMTDGTNAAGLQTQVAANKQALEVLNGTGVGSVTKAVGDEAALRVAEENRAKGEEARIEGLVTSEESARKAADEALGERLDTLEAIQHHDHENKTVLDGITAEKVAAWDGKAEVSAVEGVQGEVDALEGRVAAVEGRSHHEHANKVVLDGISAEKVAAWDGKAEVSAVEAVDGKVDTLRTDMVAVFNALDLEYEENKIKLVLPAEQAGVTTPLGEVELPILTGDEADALLVELGLVGE